MEWIDGMEYISANQNCQNSPSWPWRSCKCYLNYHFNYHSSRNNRTIGSLLAGSASWPFRIMPQVWLRWTRADLDRIHHHALITSYMWLASSKCWSIIRQTLGLFQIMHTSPDIHAAKPWILSIPNIASSTRKHFVQSSSVISHIPVAVDVQSVYWVWLISGLAGLDWTGVLKFVFTHCGMQLKSNHFQVWELVMQAILPLGCWVFTDNQLRQRQRGHRHQQVKSET